MCVLCVSQGETERGCVCVCVVRVSGGDRERERECVFYNPEEINPELRKLCHCSIERKNI